MANTSVKQQPLKFRVAPHLVQDLGLNLYTSLPSVLVEFLANAYDAEAASASVEIDFTEIEKERAKLKADHAAELKKANALTGLKKEEALEGIVPLEERLLPATIQIVINDTGRGMSRDDLENKFLIAGRRRREEEKTTRSETGKRLLMGRKGLGKLAGFGVGHRIELTTRRIGEPHATRIVLQYEELLKKRDVSETEVAEAKLTDGGGIPKSGTRIILSQLVFESMKKREGTIEHEIADHFEAIRPQDFKITFNGKQIKQTPRNYVYAYPEPQKKINSFVSKTVMSSEGIEMPIKYRIRFTAKSLPARDRGVRVYANHRLASAPDPLDVKTGLHGFQNLQYMDAVVEADFIDAHPKHDYIATNRRSLRWEVGHLADLRKFLTEQMEEAIRRYQDVRDAKLKAEVDKDVLTRKTIESRTLPAHRKRVAKRIARILAGQFDDGVKDPEYKEQLDIFLDGLAQGDIIGALGKLASKTKPNFHLTVEKISELTAREIADHMRYVEGRLRGIEALEKICSDQAFKKGDNEYELHTLLRKSPWLIDLMYTELVASNYTETTTLDKLAQLLKVGTHVPGAYKSTTPKEKDAFASNLRPDLVFLLGGMRYRRIVIVELKAPNTPLHMEHLNQLNGYRKRVKDWLKQKGPDYSSILVEGILIGSLPDPKSKSGKVAPLLSAVEEDMHGAGWKVVDISDLLADTKQIHEDIWRVHQDLLNAAEGSEDGD